MGLKAIAQLIKPNGEVAEITPSNGTDFSRDECYVLIGCSKVEIAPLSDCRTMLLDEEGKLNDNIEINEKATELYMKGRPPHAKFVADLIKRLGERIIDTGTENPELNDKNVDVVIVCEPEMFR